ncbi:MAG: hypothetical protein BWK76_03575 [Desulfobulbaceae bacterium A2]|nr:MAG: hypothetical protein BWK76_03575 [Desulfobulbaceae bacterium A2]
MPAPCAAAPAPTIDPGRDGHVHTRLCLHAQGEMEDYVLAAIERGLRSLCFLEHLEVGIHYPHRTWLTEEDFLYYFEEGARLRAHYGHRIEILLGVEAGWNPEARGELRRILLHHPWDRIGISYHYLPEGARHLNMLSHRPHNIAALAALGTEAVGRRYLEGLLEAVTELPGQVLCHLDATLRHLGGPCPLTSHTALVGQLFDLMATRDMALEVNSSGVDRRGSAYPARPWLLMARRRGLRLEAGSDAHLPEQVGRHFQQLPGLIEAIDRELSAS